MNIFTEQYILCLMLSDLFTTKIHYTIGVVNSEACLNNVIKLCKWWPTALTSDDLIVLPKQGPITL